jgi:hypothetical protein
MNFRNHVAGSRFRRAGALAALIVAVPLCSAQAQAPSPQAQTTQLQAPQPPTEAGFGGPSFRKGLWRFVRTLDVVRNANKNVKYRLVDREMTRCVDPTQAMKATFSTTPVGSCVSDKPEKVGNKYTFGHRCDYLGAVSTVITVHSDEAYTEVNEVNEGDHPKTDLVIAKRIGDCGDDKAEDAARSSVSSLQH